MRHRILSTVALTLCVCISSQSVAHAYQEGPSRPEEVLADEVPDGPDMGDEVMTDQTEGLSLPEEALADEVPDEPDQGDGVMIDQQEDSAQPEDDFTDESAAGPITRNSTVPTPAEVNQAMIALKNQDAYKEGTSWTDDEPFSDSKGYYYWKGGVLDGKRISAVGCVAFAFILSDEAFGSLPARMYAAGSFSFEDIKPGDILRVNNDAHTVIVLEVSDAGVVVAEGNISTGDHKGKVHWGRAISKDEVMKTTSHYITRYPEGYIPPDDPEANTSIAAGTLDGGLAWNLTKAGTLTISGRGAMPDFGGTGDQPWKDSGRQIRKVVIGEGVTSIGSCAFWGCGVLGVEISSSVTTIGNSAFRDSQIVSVTIPSGVKTIDDSAFRECQNLSSVTVREGVETIGQNAFRSCTGLTSIALPASIGEVGSGAFFQCTAMVNATFASGSKRVKLGDNIFTECFYLMNVTLPRNIDCIGMGMFQNCLMLAGVEIPQGAESIGESAFASCSGMTVVVIPNSVTTIGSAAFSAGSLTDIYFTGTEAQWKSISKIGDTASTLAKVTVHYNYTPATGPDSDPDDGDDSPGDTSGSITGGDNSGNSSGNISGENKPGSGSGDNGDNHTGSGSGSGDNAGNHTGSGSDRAEKSLAVSSIVSSGINAVMETWEPATPDEKKRYACMGKEAVSYTQSKENACLIDIENAMQGPLCFQSFEAVLGDYTIGRTYNIYAFSNTIYSTDKKIEFTIKIPSALYKEGREYKMICVTKGGQPIVYNDLDNNPQTITIKTDRFYAYALIYK